MNKTNLTFLFKLPLGIKIFNIFLKKLKTSIVAHSNIATILSYWKMALRLLMSGSHYLRPAGLLREQDFESEYYFSW